MNLSNSVVVSAEVSHTFLTKYPVFSRSRETLAADETILVLCSSMTRAELEVYQQKLGIKEPLICETGAAILIPDGYYEWLS